jgi:hypothetical protein
VSGYGNHGLAISALKQNSRAACKAARLEFQRHRRVNEVAGEQSIDAAHHDDPASRHDNKTRTTRACNARKRIAQ